MAKVMTPFSAEQDGFRFVNRFEVHFPVRYNLPFVGSVDLSDVVFGLCGGMCAGALDYFYSPTRIPDYDRPEGIDQRLFSFLCQRQLDGLAVPVLLRIIEWMMIEDGEVATRMLRNEIPRLRRRLDSGLPTVLCMIRVKGLGDLTKNHQVVATGYELTPDGKSMDICLYDPNHPRSEPEIQVELNRKTFALSQSSGEPLRGFFLMQYIPQKSVPKPPTLGAVAFSPPDGFQLQWPVDSRVCTQGFNEHPERYQGFGLPGHEGLDLLAMDSARVYACADGEVFEAGPRQGHPYGIQVRIRHDHNGAEYHTTYAHLREVSVRPGQLVTAGQQIGRADSTGNSTGPHLHLTLKKVGAQTGKYPAGIIDPWPYLQSAITPPDKPPSSLSGITVYTNAQVNLRAQPNLEGALVTTLPVAEGLAVLGNAEVERPKIGQPDRWLEVKTASGQTGYIAAWLVMDTLGDAFPPSGLVVYPLDQVNLRSGPATTFPLLGAYSSMEPLSVLGDAEIARSRIGQQNQWLQVIAQNGQRGFVAAWLVRFNGQLPPKSGLVVYPTMLLNVRARPDASANLLTIVTPEDALSVLGDKAQALERIGRQDQWLNIQTQAHLTGYVAAWLVQSAKSSTGSNNGNATVRVYPTDGINLRAQPTGNAPVLSTAARGEPLTIIEADLPAAQAKIGQVDQWVYVEKHTKQRGWAAAWYLATRSA